MSFVTHFDGKLLEHLYGTRHDFLAIVVSGLYVENLPGIFKLPVGNGAMMNQDVMKLMIEWTNVKEHQAAF